MIVFIIKRLAAMVLVLFAVSVLVFTIFNVIPGDDPAVRMAGKNPTETQIEAIRKEWGFDKSVPVQYVTTMKKVFSGDLISYSTRENVVDRIVEGIPRTVALTIGAAILMLLGGVLLGVFSALRPNSAADRTINGVAVVGISLPVMWLGSVVAYYGSQLGLVPNGGYVEISEGGFGQWFWHLIAPWTVLSILFVGIYSRVLRGDMVETLRSDHVRTARAKGLPERAVISRHGLRLALIPMLTLWGLDVGLLLGGGAVITESVFNLDGVGAYFADSVGTLDVPPVLAITLFGATVIVVLNAIIDILYAFLDPRIRR